jgi:predicted anti-sigma-YlaC factor YlaD
LNLKNTSMKQINDHIRAQELFSAYIDQQTTADEKQFIERHLAACDQNCRAVLAQTRSMISVTKALPSIKAPRSFVLPKTMERKPARSIFDWYPALRLATSIAVIMLVVVFASDALTPRSTGLITNIPTSASAPQLSITAMPTSSAVNAAPPAAPMLAPAPQAGAALLPTPTAPADASSLTTFAQPAMTSTMEADIATAKIAADNTLTQTEPVSVAVAFEAGTPVADETAAAASPNGALVAREANQPAEQLQPIGPTTNPLRTIELILAALVIGLIAATLIARQRAQAR